MGSCNSCHCKPMPQKTTVFLSKDKEVYRIPALFYDKDSKVFLAFAEQRESEDDTSGKNLVMKTGTLKEETCCEKTIEWSGLKVVEQAHLDGHRPMNPCPVYDNNNKTLFLFFICVEGTVSERWQIDNYTNKARLCYVTSTDAGQTWSTVTDLTDNPELADIKNSATFGVGPGHGIQMESGRLVVPIYAYTKKDGQETKSYALSLCSDDSGKTWHLGKMLQNESNECQMAEFFDDKGTSVIYCNARGMKGKRVEALCQNEGGDFKELQPAKEIVETGGGCQGSVVSFPAEGKDTNSNKEPNKNEWLLFTHPSDQSNRVDLGVYLNKSPQDPNAWSKPWILNSGPSGYSDLAYIGDGWFACLVECGEEKETEQTASVVFHYDDNKPILWPWILVLSFLCIIIFLVILIYHNYKQVHERSFIERVQAQHW